MRLAGEATLHAPAARVWTALADPAVLARIIPGCEYLTVTGPGSAGLAIAAAAASTSGTYTGTVEAAARRPPHSLLITTALTGAPGTLTATAHIHLTEPGSATNLSYEANAEVTGPLAAVGQSLLQATATRLITQFLESLGEHLTSHTAPEPAPAEPGRPPVGAAGVPSPAPPPTSRVPAPTVAPETRRGQPAVTRGAALAAPATTFALGALAGAAAALAAVGLGRLRSRRHR